MSSTDTHRRPLRVLVVEDSDADVTLLGRELRRGGFEATLERVDTAEALRAALAAGRFDLVVSDWKMPGFSALGAVALVRELSPEVPVIIVSGTVGEETAVEALRAGAADFVTKDHPARLVPAVERELREAVNRRARLDAERRLEAERRAREAEERFRHLLRMLPLPMYACDPEKRVTVFNEQAAALWGGRPAPDERWCDSCRLFTPEGTPVNEDACPTAEALRGRDGRAGVEVVLERLDGRRLTVVSHAQPIRDAAGEVVAAVNVFVDVTGMREAERALRASEQAHRLLADALKDADRRKDEFLGMLSHELRNPLAPIRNSLYVLEHAEPAGQEARRAKAVASRQIRHLTRLVDDLLDVTRIASGKIRLRRAELDLGALVVRTAEDYRPLMAERHLDLVLETPGEPLVVDGDETRLAQVLGNLLQNAAKFTPAGGRVTLAALREGDRAIVQVRDTGCGIEPALLEAIFEPFTQGKQTLARSEGGLGLGLALVKGLVALHGGEVTARSDGAGLGATLTVTLPALSPDELAVSARIGRAEPVAARRRVLVVDDNRDAADSMAQIVELLGHEASVAYDGATALALARARDPDVVLCDLGLPAMDGFTVARRLREEGARRVRLVAVSGYAQPDDVRAATEAGFDDHLAKPADLEAIVRVLG